MKKRLAKFLVVLIICQMIISLSDINIVMANSLQSQSDHFLGMGRNRMASLSISITNLSRPGGMLLGVVHFVTIAWASALLLLTALRILKDDTLDKAKAKKALSVNLLLLVLAVAGPSIVGKIIGMLM